MVEASAHGGHHGGEGQGEVTALSGVRGDVEQPWGWGGGGVSDWVVEWVSERVSGWLGE